MEIHLSFVLYFPQFTSLVIKCSSAMLYIQRTGNEYGLEKKYHYKGGRKPEILSLE